MGCTRYLAFLSLEGHLLLKPTKDPAKGKRKKNAPAELSDEDRSGLTNKYIAKLMSEPDEKTLKDFVRSVSGRQEINIVWFKQLPVLLYHDHLMFFVHYVAYV